MSEKFIQEEINRLMNDYNLSEVKYNSGDIDFVTYVNLRCQIISTINILQMELDRCQTLKKI